MTGYLLPLSCPTCGAAMAHVNSAGAGTQAVAVARCGPCEREYTVTVHLRALQTPKEARAAARRRGYRATERVAPLSHTPEMVDA